MEQRDGEKEQHLVQEQKQLEKQISGVQDQVHFSLGSVDKNSRSWEKRCFLVQCNTKRDVSMVKEGYCAAIRNSWKLKYQSYN